MPYHQHHTAHTHPAHTHPAHIRPGPPRIYYIIDGCGEGDMEVTWLMHHLALLSGNHDCNVGVMEVIGRMHNLLFYAQYHEYGEITS